MRRLIRILPVGTAIVLTLSLPGSGCSRKSSESANTQLNAQTNQVVETANSNSALARPMQPAPAAAAIIQADGQPNMDELNRLARFWMYRNHRRPADWEDFVAHAGVQIPPPPPGKKYVLSKSMRVTLEDR